MVCPDAYEDEVAFAEPLCVGPDERGPAQADIFELGARVRHVGNYSIAGI